MSLTSVAGVTEQDVLLHCCQKNDIHNACKLTSAPFSLHTSQFLQSMHFQGYDRKTSPISGSCIQLG